ncbi:hypothetical protein [Candidatus Poriferisodalis sp.]|uniref:hypothetical protein n=1 Tax=Candidatus Poriferisodalis sp. TaxID=3101277 RepID=UPI003B01324E
MGERASEQLECERIAEHCADVAVRIAARESVQIVLIKVLCQQLPLRNPVERVKSQHCHFSARRIPLKAAAVVATEPIGLAARNAVRRPTELIQSLADFVKRWTPVGGTRADLIQTVDKQRLVAPLRPDVKRHEIPGAAQHCCVAEAFALVLELNRLAGSSVA